jgi:hypothetical protein
MSASVGKGAKNKGNAFERKVAKLFTKWWNEAKLEGEFYKTPASGALRWGARDDVIGDLCTPEGFNATIECKCSESWKFRELFQTTIAKAPSLIQKGKNKGKPNAPSGLGEYWYQACNEGLRANKIPFLVFTKNYYPDYIMVPMNETNMVVYHQQFLDVGIVKRFVEEEHLPYMRDVYVMKLEDFMNIVEPKMLLRS